MVCIVAAVNVNIEWDSNPWPWLHNIIALMKYLKPWFKPFLHNSTFEKLGEFDHQVSADATIKLH